MQLVFIKLVLSIYMQRLRILSVDADKHDLKNMLLQAYLPLLILFVGFTSAENYKVTQQVYLDVAIEDTFVGRIVIGLFGELTPKTAKNFYELATDGIDRKTYAGTTFHRVIKRFMIQGGDIVHNNGSGSISIYGKHFSDENFKVKHSTSGFVSMANAGAHTNGCQFFITTIQTSWLDEKHVVFGKVIDGQNIVHKIEHLKTDYLDRPMQVVKILRSGDVPTPSSFYVSDEAYTILEIIKAGALPIGMSICILTFFQYVIQRLRQFENIKFHDN